MEEKIKTWLRMNYWEYVNDEEFETLADAFECIIEDCVYGLKLEGVENINVISRKILDDVHVNRIEL